VIKEYIDLEKIGSKSWRDLLQEACETPEKTRDIAEAVGHVSIRTLQRWASGESSPQRPEMLLQAIPTNEMTIALQDAFPEAFHLSKSSHLVKFPITLPNDFYREVLHAYAQVPKSTKRYTIFGLVSTQMIPHLDIDLQGLVIVLIRISLNDPHQIQFLEGAGNNVWVTRQVDQPTAENALLFPHVVERNPFFLQLCHPSQVPACLRHAERIKSLGFFPIFRSGLAAGGILLCATQEDFFTPLRRTLIEEYSYILSLAFNDQDFE
jgi:hypothetical protein